MAVATIDELRNEIADGATTVHCVHNKPGLGVSLLKYFFAIGLVGGAITAAGVQIVNDINQNIAASYTVLENVVSNTQDGDLSEQLSRMAADSIPGFDASIPQHARAHAAMGFLGQIMDEVDLDGKIDATVAVGKTDISNNRFHMTLMLTSDDGASTTCATIRSHGAVENVVDLGRRSLVSWSSETAASVEAVRYQVAKAVYGCISQGSFAEQDELGAGYLSVFDKDVHDITTVIGGASLYKSVHSDPSAANEFLTSRAEVLRTPSQDEGASELTRRRAADALDSVITVMDAGRDYLLDPADLVAMTATMAAFAADFHHVEGTVWIAPDNSRISTNPADEEFGWDIIEADGVLTSKRRFIDVAEYKIGISFEDPFGFTFDAHGAQFGEKAPLPKLRPIGIIKKTNGQGYDDLIPKSEDMPPIKDTALKM